MPTTGALSWGEFSSRFHRKRTTYSAFWQMPVNIVTPSGGDMGGWGFGLWGLGGLLAGRCLVGAGGGLVASRLAIGGCVGFSGKIGRTGQNRTFPDIVALEGLGGGFGDEGGRVYR